MKQYYILFFLLSICLNLFSQWDLPVTFEYPNEVSFWNSFANNNLQDDLLQVENPDKSGINSSDSCCLFTIDSAATRWVGAWSNTYGYVAFTQSRHRMKIMVYSDEIHTIGVRGQNPLEPGAGQYGAVAQATMTKTNEWEELTLELDQSVGLTYSVLAFFADINENRTKGSTLYWDNLDWIITSSLDPAASKAMIRIYPNPVADRATIECNGMTKITLMNAQGQALHSLELGYVDRKVIDLTSFSTGIYFVLIETDDGVKQSKIFKR